MPFIRQEDRGKPDCSLNLPGELCFKHYRSMIREWKKYPSWGTADVIATRLFPEPSERARFLAFLVFFSLHVIPYELQKREEHGEIE